MKAAPGAQLAIQDIFGRDEFIGQVWRTLETNSVRLEAERRIGKTSILNKMTAEPQPGWEAVLLDLEQIHTASELAEKVCERVHDRLTGWKRQGQRLREFFKTLGGTGVGPVTFPEKKDQPDGYWKKLLSGAIEDSVEQQAEAGKRVVFLFDEMPWMLSAVADRDGEQTAMEVLDVLRSLRQSLSTGQHFRMVMCGSIGLHHVLGRLKEHGYKNQPVNDMTLIETPPLERAVASDLAMRLLEGEGLHYDASVPESIADRAGGFPFYIQWIVAELRLGKSPVTPENVDTVVKKLLTAPHDPCDLRHFKSRTKT